MADIPSAKSKLNDIQVAADAAVTEALFNQIGANINWFIDNALNKDSIVIETFTSSGTFNVPADVSDVFLLGRGGSGGGAGANTTIAGGGGAGCVSEFYGPVTVTPSGSVSVTIGAGGAGGAAATAGADGGDSSFGSIVFKGGKGGGTGNAITFTDDNPATGGDTISIPALRQGGYGPVKGGDMGQDGMRSIRAAGGASADDAGGGGGAGDGAGGAGGVTGSINGSNGTEGGGGGGGFVVNGTGGDGTNGKIIVIYFDPGA